MPQNRIGRLRRAKGWSEKQLAGFLGVHPRTISRWESGATKRVPDDKAAQLCDLFGVSLAHLLGFTPEDNETEGDGNGDGNGERQAG